MNESQHDNQQSGQTRSCLVCNASVDGRNDGIHHQTCTVRVRDPLLFHAVIHFFCKSKAKSTCEISDVSPTHEAGRGLGNVVAFTRQSS